MDDSPSIFTKVFSLFSSRNKYIGEEVQTLLEEREENNEPLTEEEHSLMAAALQFYKMEANDVSIPRSDIIFLNIDDDFEKTLAVFKESRHSRLPVCGKDSDDVLGFITLKDMIQHIGNEKNFKLRKVMRPCTFVPDTSSVSYILKEMQKSRRQIAITVDEYGGTSGLITLKDILENLVGDIDDENDKDDKLMIMPLPGNKYRVDPRIEIDDLQTRLNKPLFVEIDGEAVNFDTLGGLVLHLAGRVPESGEVFKSGTGLLYKVLESDGRRIHRIEILPAIKKQKSTPVTDDID